MANFPYINENENLVLGLLKMYSRMGAFPIDPTSVFNNKDEVLAYINEPGSYAYPGQIIAVANGDISNNIQDTDYSLCIIKSDKSIQEIGKNLTFSSIEEATRFVNSNKSSVHPGELITVGNKDTGYTLNIVQGDYTLRTVELESEEIPEISWENLQNKPTSSVQDIDNAVSVKHNHLNKEVIDKFDTADNRVRYESNPIAYMSDISWENLPDKPTDLGSLGIEDVYTSTQVDNLFVKNDDIVSVPEAGKILKLDDNAQIPASILSGTIPLASLPHGALERCVVVTDDTARYELTPEDVQLGDTVKVNDTGMMYFVVDVSKLHEDGGYEVYSAGTASNVAWSGITNKPTTIAGYGITDAVNTNIITDYAEAGKLLKLDEQGKLPTDITGDAKTLDGKRATDFVSTDNVSDTPEAGKLLKLNGEGKLPADITGSAANVEWSGVQNTPNTLSGYGITDAISNVDIVSVPTPNKVLKLNENGELPANITGNAATATNVEWSGVQSKPNTLEGYGITDAYTSEHIDNTFINKSEVVSAPEAGKLLKLNEEAKLPADITGNAATATNVEWSGVQNTPNTLSGYGITDAYNKTESDEKYIHVTDVVDSAEPSKILKLDTEGKLPASILNGIIPLANLPHGALERCIVVASDTARFSLTNLNVQNGDTVKVENTGKMYFVVDESKLGSEAGYEVYTAAAATAVPWSGVQNTPTTLSGYGITDAYTSEHIDNTFVNVEDVSSNPEAGKLLKLDEEGKLPADITGNAATATNVEWSGVQSKPNTLEGYGITDAISVNDANNNFVSINEVVNNAVPNKILKLNADGKLPADITGSAGSVAWSSIIGGPTSETSEIDDAVTLRHNHLNKDTIDKLGINESGKLTFNEINTLAYMSDVSSIISVGAVEPDSSMPVGGMWLDTNIDEIM